MHVTSSVLHPLLSRQRYFLPTTIVRIAESQPSLPFCKVHGIVEYNMRGSQYRYYNQQTYLSMFKKIVHNSSQTFEARKSKWTPNQPAILSRTPPMPFSQNDQTLNFFKDWIGSERQQPSKPLFHFVIADVFRFPILFMSHSKSAALDFLYRSSIQGHPDISSHRSFMASTVSNSSSIKRQSSTRDLSHMQYPQSR